jgi:hypothetical protein
VVIDGVLAMAGGAGTVDLESLQSATANCRADILLGMQDIQRTTRTITRDRWHPTGYKAALAAIEVKLRQVMCFSCCF